LSLTYSIITPARDEAAHLPRLASALQAQTRAPVAWVIVENGSADDTAAVAEVIGATYPPARLVVHPADHAPGRGAPIVRAFQAGLAAIDDSSDVIVNVDADVTMGPDYFEHLLEAFERHPRLGIASGSAYELDEGIWRQRFVTGGTVWGATRAYRRACLVDVMPLEERHGWDGIDQLKARSRGWQTATYTDLPFKHHRPEGARDGSSWAHWRANGETAHYMGYRPTYLLMRSAFRAWRDPAALGLVDGYVRSALARAPQLEDDAARAVLREDQRLRSIVMRRREALGRSSADLTESSAR
jgi:glycosyltransferase involved in cell wall biosynthesis